MNCWNIMIFVIVYVIGVLVAQVFLAWLNANEEKKVCDEWVACLSWLYVAAVIVIVVLYVVTRPFNWFYERVKRYFNEV